MTGCACGCDRPVAHMHHFDYSKPLEVWWLSEDCHQRLHVDRPFARMVFSKPPAPLVNIKRRSG